MLKRQINSGSLTKTVSPFSGKFSKTFGICNLDLKKITKFFAKIVGIRRAKNPLTFEQAFPSTTRKISENALKGLAEYRKRKGPSAMFKYLNEVTSENTVNNVMAAIAENNKKNTLKRKLAKKETNKELFNTIQELDLTVVKNVYMAYKLLKVVKHLLLAKNIVKENTGITLRVKADEKKIH